MDSPSPPPQGLVEIRRYSNRRFYDTSRSKHVTLDEIRQMICDGLNLRITDAASGEDITSRTLTQIILEFDEQKITAFPSAVLHQLIRSSESLLHEFMQGYFENATRLFNDSKQSMEEQWQRLGGLSPLPKGLAGWWQGAPLEAPPSPGAAAPAGGGSEAAEDVKTLIEDLQNQLRAVRAELRDLQGTKPEKSGRAARGKTRKE